MLTHCQNEDASCIELIKQLNIDYVRQEECLILVTMSMEGIISNFHILSLRRSRQSTCAEDGQGL